MVSRKRTGVTMDSRLENLFRHIPRHAESADTRLGIRRDEKREQGGRRDRDDARGDDAPPAADRMSVSTATLILFLENLTGAQAPAAAVVPEPSAAAPLTPSARAAQAYQTADRGGRPAPPPAPAPGPVKSGTEGDITLTAEEMRQTHLLIAQLRALAARGVDTLDIEWQGGFLQSVAHAARMAESGPV